MKLLLDQGLPRSAAERLRAEGWDAVHTGEVGMAQASDADILARAGAEGRVVATLDADFHALLAQSGAAAPSVIRFRIQGLRGEEAARLLRDVCARFDEDLEQGSVVTVQEGRARVRRLPLAPPDP